MSEQRYKIKSFVTAIRCGKYPGLDEWTRAEAEELRDKYGLTHLSIEEVVLIWQDFSENTMCAGWLIDDKESIEEAFDVVLEPIE